MIRNVISLFALAIIPALLVSQGCIDPSVLSQKKEEETDGSASPAAANEGAPVADQPEQAPQPQGFSQLEWKLVDKAKALEVNPDLVETENRINAVDPLTSATQSYFTLGSRVHLAAFKHSVDLHKAQYDKNPSFEEFDTMMRQANVELKGLYPWQVYAYDEKTGEISILEDRAEKARMYKERGLPVPQ